MTGRHEYLDDPSRQDSADETLDYALAIPANRISPAAAPVEHMLADHIRVRIACDLLEYLARRPAAAGRRLPAALGRFFRHDFARHCDEEDNDFLPLLERRLAAGGLTDGSPNQLRAGHAAARNSLRFIVPLLEDLAMGQEIADLAVSRTVIESFVKSVRRHLAWEDDILARLADTHLTMSDLETLAAGVARRRNGAKG